MAPISQSILASMPEEIEPEEEGARPFLDLDKLRSDANRVVQVRRTVAKIQQKKQGATEDVAAELSATDLSSRQLCLKELAGALPRFGALIAAKIPQAPLIDPTLLRQISQVVPTIAASNLALKSLGTAASSANRSHFVAADIAGRANYRRVKFGAEEPGHCSISSSANRSHFVAADIAGRANYR